MVTCDLLAIACVCGALYLLGGLVLMYAAQRLASERKAHARTLARLHAEAEKRALDIARSRYMHYN